MEYQDIQLSSERGIYRLLFNRPETRNSMTPRTGDEIVHAVATIRGDANARVVILSGSGKSFSSGGDLRMLARDAELASVGPNDSGENEAPTMAGSPRDFYLRFLSIRQLPVPVIAAINGHAIGAGLCIALACDLRIAKRGAKMGMTFGKLGLHPGMGATYFLPRLVGTAKACELFFTSRIFDADEACEMGVVNKVVTEDDFEDAVATMADEIASCGPTATRMVKKSIYRGVEDSLEKMLDYESVHQAMTFANEDAREGIQAALEKRPPRFS